ncbi:DUF7544 domain-containing protein [Paenibacillus sabinae]|uniref:Uncharacterized protein n=1 Tax=Paenibacillus sabinae T27 TaxID=1268072 RepID=X4ZY43_9BACL|nr:hypothetical protein [Paenibacillus sabinae]AHV96599.1 hypothetical protein PSAB_08335 [Paenibacillus sabinae T27]
MDEQDFPKQDPQQNNPYTGAPGFSPYPEEPRKLKHSGPGIASFVIAMVTIVGYIVSFIVAAVLIGQEVHVTITLADRGGEGFLFLGLSVLALAALNLIGLVVGIIGLALRGRRKVFGIIGTIINGLILLMFVLLIVVVLADVGALS